MLVFFTSFFNYFSCILLFFLSQFSHFTFTQNHFFILSLSHLIFFIFSFSLFLFFFTTPQKSSPTQRKIAHAKTKIQLSVLVSHSRSQGIQETPDIPLKERKRQGDFCCFSSGTVTLFLAGSHYFSLHLLSFSMGFIRLAHSFVVLLHSVFRKSGKIMDEKMRVSLFSC